MYDVKSRAWIIDFWRILCSAEKIFKVNNSTISEAVRQSSGNINYAYKIVKDAKKSGFLEKIENDVYTIGHLFLDRNERYVWSREVKSYKQMGYFYKFKKEN